MTGVTSILPTDRISDAIEWRVEPGLTPYPHALAVMEARAAAIREETAGELAWMVEHPPLYTAGTSAGEGELLAPGRFPVFETGRGGRYTYHGPGQRTGYLMIDLAARGRDVRRYVHALEDWLIATLGDFGIAARSVPDRVGIWVDRPGGEAKIGAIGVRVKRWVTLHGFALNVSPELAHFGGIVPCGLPDFAVTSLADCGVDASMADVDAALQQRFSVLIEGLGPVAASG